MIRTLYVVFFLSGMSALLFETLWFRLAGLTFGNGVWASSIVLASFMAGLALGNALAARHGERIADPVRAYAVLELLIGGIGFGLVLVFPFLNVLLSSIFHPLVGNSLALNLVRLAGAFVLMLVPASAMGATLPLMVKGLRSARTPFGQRLGMLYGCNTLGAVAGALAGEMVLIHLLGLRGSGLVALGANVLAAAVALRVARLLRRETGPDAARPDAVQPRPLTARSRGLLAAAFMSGAVLLALEVVWFRFMLLFTFGTSLVFSVMLAVVLAGIGIGGTAASRWLRARAPDRVLPAVACVSGVLVVGGFALFASPQLGVTLSYVRDDLGWVTAARALGLMFPVSLASGVLFTLIGAALHAEIGSETRSAGLLTLFNTVGAMLGALLAGFVLLPLWGMERSFLALAIAYVAVAAFTLVPHPTVFRRTRARVLVPAVIALGASLVAFPFGALGRHVFPRIAESSVNGPHEIALVREGLTETILYVRRDKFGLPFFHKLLTNGHAMAATNTHSQHYMKLYVYLPLAVHPGMRDALLISYGCGQTAKALTDTDELDRIDVVDISRDILEATEIVFDEVETSPLRDPRVHVFVEDGRFFLQTTTRTYDLITGEPPPPTAAGTVNLYSREYFQLIHDRLKPGGMATYWLPQHALDQDGARAIIRAFTDVFEESSLWIGCGQDWMLLGVRGPHATVSEERFGRQWRSPVVAPILQDLGFEYPEQLAAYFIADRPALRDLVTGTEPVTDDRPQRLSPPGPVRLESAYATLIEPAAARDRFARSDHVRRLFPDGVRRRGVSFFDFRYELHDGLSPFKVGPRGASGLAGVHHVITGSPFHTLVLWLLGSSVREQQIVATVVQGGVTHPALAAKLGDLALARRDFPAAVEHYRIACDALPDQVELLLRLVLALCLAERRDEAQALVHARAAVVRLGGREDWVFLAGTYGLRLPGPG